MAKIDDILYDGTINGHVIVSRWIGLVSEYQYILYDGNDPYQYEIEHSDSDINFMWAEDNTLYIELQPITGSVENSSIEIDGVKYPITTIAFDNGYDVVVGPTSLQNEECCCDLDENIAYYIDDDVLATEDFTSIVRALIDVDEDILEEI